MSEVIVSTLTTLLEPGDVAEVRILNALRGKGVVAGYYNDFEKVGRDVVPYLERAKGIYVTLNRLNPDLLARSANRLTEFIADTTTDQHVTQRRWLLVDIDAKRVSGVSSTDEEHTAALERCRDIGRRLQTQGWPKPVYADSGNGGHLLYRIDLPNDEPSRQLIERCLKALAQKFDDDRVSVDITVSNASRITKLYGTPVRKGDNTSERPHRCSKILFVPSSLEAVPVSCLSELAGAQKEGDPKSTVFAANGSYTTAGPFDMEAFLRKHGLVTESPVDYRGGRKWQTDCLFNADHKSPDAAFYVTDRGAAAYHCSHASCAGKDWYSVRELLGDRNETRTNKVRNGTSGLPNLSRSRDAPKVTSSGIVDVVTIADVEREEVEWLWHRRIAKGKITLFTGDPGLGKSTLSLQIAASVSRGTPLPDMPDGVPSSDVLLLSLEDGVADTIRPRLEAAGADLTRVHIPQFKERVGEEENAREYVRPPVLPDDLNEIGELIRRYGAGLLIIDPLMAVLSGTVNSFKDQDIRKVMAALSFIAEDTGCAVLILRHLTKGGGSNAMYRGGGSIGITGAARSELLVARDPDDEERRILAAIKNNLSKFAPSLAFRLVDVGEVGRVQFEGETSHSADSLLVPGDTEEVSSAIDEADEFLREILEDGPTSAASIFTHGKNGGLSEKTIRRAAKRLGIKPKRTGGIGSGGGWFWSLPGTEDAPF
ncbi:MAG: AAA family ATPase [Capsulimonadales bacterium]|nr:AAA family ATPase [Capsulimonadales bacterium]